MKMHKLLLMSTFWLLGFSPVKSATFAYVSVAGEKKILLFRVSPENGKLEQKAALKLTGEPGALTVDPDRRVLFASLRSTGELASFRIDPKSGRLAQVSKVPAGADPAFVSTDRKGRYLLTAYYRAGKVTVHRIGKEGALDRKPLQTVRTDEKAHAILTDRSNRWVFVPHTGPNAIFQFGFDPSIG